MAPELAKRLDTFKELLDNADEIAIISIKNTVAPQYMAKSSNIYLKKLQAISDATGPNSVKNFYSFLHQMSIYTGQGKSTALLSANFNGLSVPPPDPTLPACW